MDFDIDAVLDQLEKTLNQSDLEEKESNQIIQTSPPTSTSTKSVDELLLLDLDPLGSIENNNNNNEENGDKLERLKQDLQELYASSTVINPPPSIPNPTLPDIIGQQEEFSSTSLPFALEQLELEVRHEILQHTFEQPSSSSPLLLPDLTTLPNGNHDDKKEAVFFSTSFEEDEEEEEKLSSTPVIEETAQTSKNVRFQNEPDLIQHETPATQTPTVLHSVDSIVNAPMGSDLIQQERPATQTPTVLHSVDSIVNAPMGSDLIQHERPTTQTPTVIHSVDSIVNAPMASDLEDFITSNPSVIDTEPFQSSSELVFTACDDSNQGSIQSLPEEPISNSPPPSPPPSPSTTIPTAAAPIQDFDLVKNILSEIFDKPDEEILDENPVEEKESGLVNIEQQEIASPPPPPSVTTNNDEDFRFLDEMLASMDVSDADIHQLTPAEIDRVDNLLKQIVNSHQTEETAPPPIANEIESSPTSEELPPSSSLESSLVPSLAAAAGPIDEELIRVEQEWAKLTEEDKRLGSVAPEWVSDDLAPACMKCASKFSITRRRHHCRACGKVFCSNCCWQRVKLIHDDSKEDRACNDCVKTINNGRFILFSFQ